MPPRLPCSLARAAAVFLMALLASSAALAQKIIHIPADQPTIQAGINAAATGDTVLVSPGTYFENIDFKGKAITVTSSGGAAATILDGSNGKAPAVTFKTSETRSAILSGLTIQGGGLEGYTTQYTFPIGGIYIGSASPTIVNNTITHNHCYSIQSNGAPLIQNNEIDNTLDNHGDCSFAGGAAVYLQQDLPYGYSNNISPIVIGNLIQNNTQSGREDAGGNGGAGIAVWTGIAVIENNIIRNNISGGQGAAIHLEGNGGLVIGNVVYNNQSGGGGGALDVNGFYADFRIYPTFNAFIANNTFVNNTFSASIPGGSSNDSAVDQIYFGSYGFIAPTLAFVNNIVAGDSALPAIQCGWTGLDAASNVLVMDHNLFFNAGGPVFTSLCTDPSGTFGNLTADPKFINGAANDFHLAAGSPAIDAGNNSALAFLSTNGVNLSTDIDGNPRLQDATGKGYPVIDIGALEALGLPEAGATTLLLSPSTFEATAGSNITFTLRAFSPLGIPAGPVTLVEDGTNTIGTIALDAKGTGAFTVACTPGIHHFVAQYPGQGLFTPATSIQIIVFIEKYPAFMTITSSPNPSQVGQSVTVTVNISSPDNAILSPIVFVDLGTTLATVNTSSAGIATYTTSTLTRGTHFVTASYAGDATHSSNTIGLVQTVLDPNDTAIRVTSSANPSILGQPVTFTALVTSSGGTVPTGLISFSDGGTLLGSSALDPSGQTTLTISTLSLGSHTITAMLAPTGTFHASSGSAYQQVIAGYATTASLTSSLNPSTIAQPVTFTAHIASSNGIPTGSVAFTDGATALGTQPLDAAGNAPLTTSALTAGTHPITATYVPTGSFAGSTASLIQTVNGLASNVTLSASPLTGTTATPITFTVLVSSNSVSSSTPTGSVNFTKSNGTFGTAPIVNGVATFTTQLPVGVNIVSAAYTGDAAFNPATSNPVTITITAAPSTLTLTSSRNPSPALAPLAFTAQLVDGASLAPVAFATINFTLNGQPLTPVFTGPTGLASANAFFIPPGTYVVTASFAGDILHGPATATTLTETVLPNPTAITLAASPSPAYQGQTVTLSASVPATTGTSAPIGSVQFLDGGALLATVALPPFDPTAPQTPLASASFSTSTLAPGTHSLTAIFSPTNPAFLASQSAAFLLTINPQTFTLTIADPTLTIQTEHHKTTTISITSTGGLPATFTLSCGPLPEAATCLWGQTTLDVPANGTISTALTIDTDVILGFKSSLGHAPLGHPAASALEAAILPLATLLLLPLASGPRRRKLRSLLPLFFLASLAVSLTACSSKYPDHTPPGTYTIRLTAISLPIGPGRILTQTADLTLVVTP
jgi:hypothetical protein